MDKNSDTNETSPLDDNDRREAFRVSTKLYIHCLAATPSEIIILEKGGVPNIKIESEIDEDPVFNQCNVSSCGIGFGVDVIFKQKSYVKLRIAHPPSDLDIMLYGKVVRCIDTRKAYIKDDKKYWLGVKFVKISSYDQNTIDKFILQQQHKNLKHLFKTKNM